MGIHSCLLKINKADKIAGDILACLVFFLYFCIVIAKSNEEKRQYTYY